MYTVCKETPKAPKCNENLSDKLENFILKIVMQTKWETFLKNRVNLSLLESYRNKQLEFSIGMSGRRGQTLYIWAEYACSLEKSTQLEKIYTVPTFNNVQSVYYEWSFHSVWNLKSINFWQLQWKTGQSKIFF